MPDDNETATAAIFQVTLGFNALLRALLDKGVLTSEEFENGLQAEVNHVAREEPRERNPERGTQCATES